MPTPLRTVASVSHLAKVAAATQKIKQQHKMQTVIRLSGHSRFHLAPYTVGFMRNDRSAAAQSFVL